MFYVSITGSSVNSQGCEKQLKVQSIVWGWATVIQSSIHIYSGDLKALHMQILPTKATANTHIQEANLSESQQHALSMMGQYSLRIL